MHVEAVDKGTSKTAKITITNNKGRLSKEEIDRLVKEAEKYKDQIENWMSNNNSAETEEYEAKQKDLERMFNPIATKLYQGAGGAEAGPRCGNSYQQGQQAGTTSGPHVDEVD
jgi:heat shock protein 1/8